MTINGLSCSHRQGYLSWSIYMTDLLVNQLFLVIIAVVSFLFLLHIMMSYTILGMPLVMSVVSLSVFLCLLLSAIKRFHLFWNRWPLQECFVMMMHCNEEEKSHCLIYKLLLLFLFLRLVCLPLEREKRNVGHHFPVSSRT